MTARTFGRKGTAYEEEMARRREAFIAEERARRAREEGAALAPARKTFGTGGARSDPVAPAARSGPVFVPQKSTFIAYLLWFAFGAVSAHRFYLGHTNSAIIQASLWFVGWLMVLSGQYYALFAPFIAAFWIIGDAFFIPSMTREANARLRARAVHHAFT